MKLIKWRIRSLEGMADSGWLTMGPGATLLYERSASGASVALRALQHISPPCDSLVLQGFCGSLKDIRQRGYYRKILPGKRTAALAVFAADVDLIQDLAVIDSDLFETDRIEVGRRLDYSRWLNFVEIASSTRWSQIAEPMMELRHVLAEKHPPPALNLESSLLEDLRATDRIRGDIANTLEQWLAQVEELVAGEQVSRIAFCRQAVERGERFAGAKRLVEGRLPRFVYLRPGDTCQSFYDIDDLEHPGTGGRGDESISHLLAGLWQKTAFAGATAKRQQLLQHDLAETVARLNLFVGDIGIMPPRFLVTDMSIRIEYPELSPDSAVGRLAPIATVLVLCQALYGRLPILLLDEFEKDLSQLGLDNLVKGIQKIGNTCQLVYASSSAYVAAWSGWSGVLRLAHEEIPTF